MKNRKNARKRKTLYTFTVLFEREDDGGYHAYCPALKGCHAQGDTYEEACTNIEDAMALYLESLRAHKEKIPTEDLTIRPFHVAL
jgi:predicted RNase H-like HicB family nuclease